MWKSYKQTMRMRRVGAVFFVTRLSGILRIALMYNLIHFTDICLELLLVIISAKHNTTLDHVMKRRLI